MTIQCDICLHDNPKDAISCEACGSPLNSSPSGIIDRVGYHLSGGTVLTNTQNQNQYRIEKTLGEGGFGITYQGIYLKTSLPIAIKENWPQGGRNGTQVIWPSSMTPQDKQEQIKKFIREGQIIHQCKHPNIVKVYDWFLANDTAYIVMEFLAGESLESLSRKQGGKLPESQVKKYFTQVCHGLKVLHSNRLLHRDIKPDNIMVLENEDKAVLIDFGNAREFIAGKTGDMTRILTPGYAPPEQYSSRGRKNEALDIYALCATMYKLLTNVEPPDATERVATISSSAPDPLVNPRQIIQTLDPILEQLILTGMKMNALERFQSVDDIIEGLQGKLISPNLKRARDLVKSQKLNDAITVYQKCIQNESSAIASIELAMVLIHINDVQAEQAAQKAINLNPNDGRGYGVLGLTKCRQSAWQEGLQYLQKGIILSPQEAWIHVNLAWAYGKIGKWEEAENGIKTAISLNHQSSFALSLQVWIAVNRKQWREANNLATRIILNAKNSPFSDSQKTLSWLYPYRLIALEYGNITQNNPNFIDQVLQEFIQRIPDSSFGFGFQGWKQAQEKSWQQALSSFQQALTKSNNLRWVLLNHAILQEYTKNFQGAINSYHNYHNKYSDNDCIWLNINQVLIPDSAFIYYRLGTLLGKNQQWVKAKEYLEKASYLHNEYAEVYHNLGWVLLNIKDSSGQIEKTRELIDIYKRAIELYKQQNRFQEAQKIKSCFQAMEIQLDS